MASESTSIAQKFDMQKVFQEEYSHFSDTEKSEISEKVASIYKLVHETWGKCKCAEVTNADSALASLDENDFVWWIGSIKSANGGDHLGIAVLSSNGYFEPIPIIPLGTKKRRFGLPGNNYLQSVLGRIEEYPKVPRSVNTANFCLYDGSNLSKKVELRKINALAKELTKEQLYEPNTVEAFRGIDAIYYVSNFSNYSENVKIKDLKERTYKPWERADLLRVNMDGLPRDVTTHINVHWKDPELFALQQRLSRQVPAGEKVDQKDTASS